MTSIQRLDEIAAIISRERWCPCRYDTTLISRGRQLWYRVERLLGPEDTMERSVTQSVCEWIND